MRSTNQDYRYKISWNELNDQISCNGPFARNVKLRVAHASRMPGTFSSPTRVSDPDMHHGTCATHVPWCMPGSLTNGFFEVGGGENVPGIPGACAICNFTYLTRDPWPPTFHPLVYSDGSCIIFICMIAIMTGISKRLSFHFRFRYFFFVSNIKSDGDSISLIHPAERESTTPISCEIHQPIQKRLRHVTGS